ncbi:hypothetical protein QR680_009345 [Steinernema hermaphroditum]|uniref:Uncharacterized protein n=1 Tax=Steinernema hermaphroditum TaxID=289476 RepID=A0AA39IMD4_9BILA|nr:hypothetical protein QR680_009345 [Steinernema hermaphroditum]
MASSLLLVLLSALFFLCTVETGPQFFGMPGADWGNYGYGNVGKQFRGSFPFLFHLYARIALLPYDP